MAAALHLVSKPFGKTETPSPKAHIPIGPQLNDRQPFCIQGISFAAYRKGLADAQSAIKKESVEQRLSISPLDSRSYNFGPTFLAYPAKDAPARI